MPEGKVDDTKKDKTTVEIIKPNDNTSNSIDSNVGNSIGNSIGNNYDHSPSLTSSTVVSERLDKRGYRIGKRANNKPVCNAFKHGLFAKKVELTCDLCIYGKSGRCTEAKPQSKCVYLAEVDKFINGTDVNTSMVLEGLKALWLQTYRNYRRALDCATFEGGIPDKVVTREAQLLTEISRLILDVTSEKRGAIVTMTDDQRVLMAWLQKRQQTN